MLKHELQDALDRAFSKYEGRTLTSHDFTIMLVDAFGIWETIKAAELQQTYSMTPNVPPLRPREK